MEEIIKKLELLTENLKNYARAKYDLASLNIFIKITNIAGRILSGIGFFIFGIMAMFFGSVALALWLGELLNSYALGFLAVAGIFILIAVILFLLRKKIVFPIIRDKLIKKYYESDQNL